MGFGEERDICARSRRNRIKSGCAERMASQTEYIRENGTLDTYTHVRTNARDRAFIIN